MSNTKSRVIEYQVDLYFAQYKKGNILLIISSCEEQI